MGFYITHKDERGAAQYLVERFGAERITRDEARELSGNPAIGVIVVIHNPPPTPQAALFANDREEFDRADAANGRALAFLKMDRADAEWFSGFADPMPEYHDLPDFGPDLYGKLSAPF